MTSIATSELTSLSFCWKIERSDGAGLALTSHDQPVERDGIVYRPQPGMVPAAIKRSLGLDPNDGEAGGALSSDALDEADLALGRWNGARISLAAIDWASPQLDPIALLGGELGAVAVAGSEFTAELIGATAKLDEPVCPATSAECRASFGDKQCRIDLEGRTIVAHVMASSDGTLTLDTAVDDRFLLGRLVYLGSANGGIQTVVIGVSGTTIEVRDLPRAAIEAGCKVELRHGCDKRFATCSARFANAVNFRGEPHLPGNDLLTRYPGA